MIAQSPPVRALIVMPLATQRGGAELMLQHLIEHREEAGLDPAVAFLRPGPMVDWCRERGVPAHVLRAGRLRQPRALARTVRAIARLARARRSEVVVGWMAKGAIYAGLSADRAHLPCVWLQAGTPGRRSRIDRAATLVPAELVITLSAEVEQGQRALRPRRRTRLVYPGVDTSRFDARRIGTAAQARRRLGLPETGPSFGSVGRLDRWKGFHVLLDAAAIVLDRHPSATFVLVGGAHELDPDYATQLEEQAARFGLNGRVRLVGQQPNPEQWMQAMDVFVHTSRNEPFGMVVIEAMALGKPVVASAEGGPLEVITPGVDGVLSPYGDHVALAAAIDRLLADQDVAASLGRAARERASDFRVQQFARRFGAAVAEVARARPRSPRDGEQPGASRASTR